MRLLLVEDDTMIGEVVLDLLRAEHYAVDWVKDGDMADTALTRSVPTETQVPVVSLKSSATRPWNTTPRSGAWSSTR